MQIPIYQIDAFTDKAFGGNPAAVCPLDAFPNDEFLQNIAIENNLSETAYLVRLDGGEADYHLRWFTPGCEVTLCGHATLASAYVVFTHLEPELDIVRFQTLSGILTVARSNKGFTMDFPVIPCAPIDTLNGLGAALGIEPAQVYQPDAVYEGANRDLLIVYPDQETLERLTPNMEALKAHAPYGFVCTAQSNDSSLDFVSRCFFPNHGIGEDPVTGSAHSLSAPFWSQKLGKTILNARQISARSGDLLLDVKGDRLDITGNAVEVMRGTLSL
jgi:PhzF family phenazine biosynthesis protein